MRGKWVDLSLVNLFCILLTIGCVKRPAPPAPTETPTPAVLPFPIGHLTNNDWSWDFKADGTFTSFSSLGSETGTYAVSGDQVVITCQCCGNVKGTYSWVFDGQSLTFRAIDDQCFNRLTVVTSGIWFLNP